MEQIGWLEANWKGLFAVLNVVFGIVIWALTSTFAKKRDHEKLTSSVASLKERIESLPDAKQVHKLELQISELSGDIKIVQPLLKRVEHQSNLLLENELDKKGKD